MGKKGAKKAMKSDGRAAVADAAAAITSPAVEDKWFVRKQRLSRDWVPEACSIALPCPRNFSEGRR